MSPAAAGDADLERMGEFLWLLLWSMVGKLGTRDPYGRIKVSI
jgi:hypothetical protein